MTPEQVERVAEILIREADALRAAYTSADGAWDADECGRRARADFCEYNDLAGAARHMVTRYWASRGAAPKGAE